MEQSKGKPAPTGNYFKAPDWQPSPKGIEGEEKLVAPDLPPPPVKMEDEQLQTTKGSTSATDTV